MSRLGQLTVIWLRFEDTVAVEPLVKLTVAWFWIVAPQVAAVVGEVMCTDNDKPEARLTPFAPPHVSVFGLVVLIAQVPFQPADGGLVTVSMLQFRPALVGSTSESFTPVAVPRPLLEMVIV